MSTGTPRTRRPRPVADAPLDALLADGARDLARGWLLALLEDRALEAAAQLPAADLAREAPNLLAAMVRSLASDADLARLGPGGDLYPLASRAGALAGASGAVDTTAAIDDLRAVVWAASLACLAHPSPEQVADLADRIEHVAATVRAAALAAVAGPARQPAAPPRTSGLAAVPSPRPPAGEAAGAADVADDGWLTALREHVAGAASGGSGLSLLLVEVDDQERLTTEQDADAGPLGAAGRAIRDALRRPDLIGFEEAGRVWVIATGTGRRGAETLAGRLATAVAAVGAPHGSPLTITVGIAVYGEDAWDAETLIAAADESALAARASGERPRGDRDGPPPGPRLVG